MTPKIAHFIAERQPPTPCLIFDLDRVEVQYRALQKALPNSHIHYAVKANPAPPILRQLVALKSRFDAASIGEIRMCLDAGADPSSILFGNTIKKTAAIRDAKALGITLFAFDCAEELDKLAQHAPGADIFCRLDVENDGADWPLSRKFGASSVYAIDLLRRAKALGLRPCGLSFHIGSQQKNAHAYESAIERVAYIFAELARTGIPLEMLDLGGGFPVRYTREVQSIDTFGATIMRALRTRFGDTLPTILVEPGRFLVAEAGVVSAEVVLVSRRGKSGDEPRWVFLDIGRFGGLAETEGEAIRYRFRTPYDGQATGESIIAGPSCDGVDVLYEKNRVALPLALASGDRIEILGTGAYVTTYCSTGFNGFAPLEEYYI